MRDNPDMVATIQGQDQLKSVHGNRLDIMGRRILVLFAPAFWRPVTVFTGTVWA